MRLKIFSSFRSTRNRQAGRQTVEYAAINKAINRLQSGAIDIVRKQCLALFIPSLHSLFPHFCLPLEGLEELNLLVVLAVVVD